LLRGSAGTDGAKVQHVFKLTKYFQKKVQFKLFLLHPVKDASLRDAGLGGSYRFLPSVPSRMGWIKTEIRQLSLI